MWPYLVATDGAQLPVPLLAHPTCDADGCYTPWLRHDDVAVAPLLGVVIQDVLGDLRCLARARRSLDHSHLVTLHCLYDLE